MSQLDDLEARVAALEAAAGAPAASTLQPNVLTVSPTGAIGADFTGVVKALGLYIPESSVQVTNQNAIIWTRSDQPNPVVLTNPPPSAIYAEEINYQFDDGTQLPGDMLRVEVDATNTPSWQALIAAIELVSTGHGGTFSQLEVRADDQAGTAKSRVWAEASNATATIIDGTGASSFLQLLSTQNLKLQVGQVSNQPIAANGQTGVEVALPTPWPTNHLGFGVIGTHYTASLQGVGIAECGPYNYTTGAPQLDHGSVVFNNGATAQNVTFWWISFGN